MDDQQTRDALLALANIASHTEWIAQLLEKLNETLNDRLTTLNNSADRIAQHLDPTLYPVGG